MKIKTYIIRNKYHPKENLGKIRINLTEDTAIIYLLDSYKGLHGDAFLPYWADEQHRKVVEGYDANHWIHRRVCPPGRHNISEVLESHGLTKYNASVILDRNKGECDKDNLWFEEISEEEI